MTRKTTQKTTSTGTTQRTGNRRRGCGTDRRRCVVIEIDHPIHHQRIHGPTEIYCAAATDSGTVSREMMPLVPRTRRSQTSARVTELR